MWDVIESCGYYWAGGQQYKNVVPADIERVVANLKSKTFMQNGGRQRNCMKIQPEKNRTGDYWSAFYKSSKCSVFTGKVIRMLAGCEKGIIIVKINHKTGRHIMKLEIY